MSLCFRANESSENIVGNEAEWSGSGILLVGLASARWQRDCSDGTSFKAVAMCQPQRQLCPEVHRVSRVRQSFVISAARVFCRI